MTDITPAQERAMKSGEDACLKAKADGIMVNLMDEGRLLLSGEDLAFAIGWNSKVFDQKDTQEG